MDVPQVLCLLFATDAKGQTLYEKMAEGKFLLGPRPGEDETQKTRHTAVHRILASAQSSKEVWLSRKKPYRDG